MLHICIPFDRNFTKLVVNQINKNKPTLTIIHSTVRPGITHEIFTSTKSLIVHSPVMGTHPNLKKDISRFTKIIGPINKKSLLTAQNHFRKVGINTIFFKNPEETEMAKLLDTTYFAWNIMFNKFVKKICDDFGLDFTNVYTKFNKIYNEGYKNTRPNVTRPILDYVEGPIGGHCVGSNAQILDKFLPNKVTRFILNSNKNLKSVKAN